jgi:hypothetical protein
VFADGIEETVEGDLAASSSLEHAVVELVGDVHEVGSEDPRLVEVSVRAVS